MIYDISACDVDRSFFFLGDPVCWGGHMTSSQHMEAGHEP